ncbi:MAG: SUMF1/EgtB/PvdO family nonheme iron enzyme [Synechococcus sp.]
MVQDQYRFKQSTEEAKILGVSYITAIHASLWEHDTDVPIVLAGIGIEPQMVSRPVCPQVIAPTLSVCMEVKPLRFCWHTVGGDSTLFVTNARLFVALKARTQFSEGVIDVLRLAMALVLAIIALAPMPVAIAATEPTCPSNMQWIEGGTFRIGSDSERPEERSAEAITLSSYCIDLFETTNEQFAQFVAETGYVTVAERPLSVEDFPDLTDAERSPGSLVFHSPDEHEPLGYLQWWKWTPGANWQHPEGPESNLEGRDRYPVVHVAYEDVVAYANWSGKSLPTEAQWEYAARGGRDSTYAWGDKYAADKANTWQGVFPFFNTLEDGYPSTAPVGSFPPNDYGLYDIIGNVWEWTADWYRVGHADKAHHHDPKGPTQSESYDPREPFVPKYTIKGGSYLCAKNYCSRYRPSAREAQSPDTGTNHIGFRLVTSLTDD